MLPAVLGVLALGVLDGLLAAIAVSLFMTLRRFSESRISVLGRLTEHGHDFVNLDLHPDARPAPGILILRPDEPLFFANAEKTLNQARHRALAAGASIHTIILSLEESPDLDTTSLEALCDFYLALQVEGKQVFFCRMKDAAQDVLKRADPSVLPASCFSGLSVDGAVRVAIAEMTNA